MYTRDWGATWPRMLAITLVREQTTYSSTEIGLLFHRDHQAILSAVRSVRKWVQVHEELAEDLWAVEALFKQPIENRESQIAKS